MKKVSVDELLERYITLQTERAKVDARIAQVITQLNATAGKPEITSGFITLKGAKYQTAVIRRINVKYTNKERLQELITQHEGLQDMFRLSIAESGQKIARLLSGEDTETQVPQDVITELKALRQATPGSCSLEKVKRIE